MAVGDQVAPRAPVGDSPESSPRTLSGAWLRRSPFLVSAVACLILAALSAALLPTVPSYDPWSWIVWGREVTDSHLSFVVSGGPSWKPLPFLFTTVYGVFGGAAPTLWVITARAGGLLGLVAAYRLAVKLTRRFDPQTRWLGVIAGVAAMLGVALTQEWSYYMFRGTSEPMLIAAALWAVDRHLDGRYVQAFLLGVAASLIRPEAWPFILLYSVWLWRREPDVRVRGVIAAGLLSIPFLWFVPPWVGSGQPFLAASHAKSYNGHLGKHPFLEVVRRGGDLQVWPMLILAALAVVLAWVRERDRVVVGLAAGALGWWILVVGMTLDGYPGLERFFLPAAGLTCVLGGVGLARVGALAATAAPGRAAWAAGAAIALVLVASVAVSSTRIDEARAQPGKADQAVDRLDGLSAAVRAVGGHHAVFPCRTSFSAVNHGVQTALAWKLHVTLERVGTSMRHQGVLFVGPHDTIDGGPAPLASWLNHKQLLATVDGWRVYRVWREGHLSPCVGT